MMCVPLASSGHYQKNFGFDCIKIKNAKTMKNSIMVKTIYNIRSSNSAGYYLLQESNRLSLVHSFMHTLKTMKVNEKRMSVKLITLGKLDGEEQAWRQM